MKIRKGLGLFCNLRPAILFEELSGACPLKEEIVEGGFDFIFARELTGGLYFGERYTKEIDGVRTAVDTLKYDENEIRRIAIQAFEIAMKRNKKSAVLIKQTYWILPDFGAKSSRKSARIIRK